MRKPNFKPNTIFCSDNLPILQKINSECVDLIYADPPFNKKKKFTAPIGSSADGAEFLDYFTMSDVKERWFFELQEGNPKLHSLLAGIESISRNKYNYAYLVYMGMRLLECKRVLKPTGSIYLHCDHTMAHYLKLAMDVIFGEKNFRNEIIWCYSTGGASRKRFAMKHDTILVYGKRGRTVFNTPRMPYTSAMSRDPKHSHKFHREGKVMMDWWTDIKPINPLAKERTGYPTQKPLKLLRRIIAASSNPGDLVLDPFCGCATACVAAQALQRKWVGIDVSELAWRLMRERMQKEVPDELQDDKYNFRTDAPKITAAHPNRIKHIYVISCASFPGKYKVGQAGDVQRRLASYQTSSPKRDYAIVFSQKTEFYDECERHIHQKFNAEHEWVTADADKIVAEIKKFIKNPDAGILFQLTKAK